MGGKIIPRIRLTSAKALVEVEAELGNKKNTISRLLFKIFISRLDELCFAPGMNLRGVVRDRVKMMIPSLYILK